MKHLPRLLKVLITTTALYSPQAIAADPVLNSMVSYQDLVTFCDGKVGNESVPAQLVINNETVTGVINCEQEYVDAAIAAVAAGNGALPAASDDANDDATDDAGDDAADDAGDDAADDAGDDAADDTTDDSVDDTTDDSAEDPAEDTSEDSSEDPEDS